MCEGVSMCVCEGVSVCVCTCVCEGVSVCGGGAGEGECA